MPAYPVPNQWCKLLPGRLDWVAMLYHVAALVAGANPERRPDQSDHYRHGPYDALLTPSCGWTVSPLCLGPMLSAANLRFRLRDDD
ncbi:MAG: hypothetical protein OXH19_00020 [Chloroflexi bacterium]|nr:hypothetical protein [Chloroflexota bacterium]MCY3587622.1 hypothetical protein [Chloroflexota bacterium]MDE2710083.1 hypothetical protein [Chloroflexota bacterium]